jgi:1,2-diacylglycerol-3-alpha-glucose alpha-1,2-glucosyltransferase
MMKVCLYGELGQVLKGSGIGTAIDHQRKALELNGVEVTRSHRDRFDVIDINTIGPRSAYVAQKMRWKGIPVVMHTHTTDEDVRDSFKFTNKLAPKMRRYLRYFYNQADLLISPTEYTRDVVRGYGVTVDVVIISNGVDVEKFRLDAQARRRYRSKYGLDGVTPFTVGHVFKRKGVLEFIDIAEKFPELQFMWYGRLYKDLADNEVKKAVETPLPNVMFTGYVRDVVAAYSSGDVFIFPSWCENQGISILEAAACGKPILVRDLPAYDGWLKQGYNCLKAKDNGEFTGNLKTLLGEPELMDKLGANALKMSREHSLERIGAQLMEVYESVL